MKNKPIIKHTQKSRVLAALVAAKGKPVSQRELCAAANILPDASRRIGDLRREGYVIAKVGETVEPNGHRETFYTLKRSA